MGMPEEISRVAYDIYEKSGRVQGRDEENWLEAEKRVLAASMPVKRQRARRKAPSASAPGRRRARKNP